MPVACDLLRGGLRNLTRIHKLTYDLPADKAIYGDKGDNEAADGATIPLDTGPTSSPPAGPTWLATARPTSRAYSTYLKRIEALGSQLKAFSIQRLRARINPSFKLKLHTALRTSTIAIAIADWQAP